MPRTIPHAIAPVKIMDKIKQETIVTVRLTFREAFARLSAFLIARTRTIKTVMFMIPKIPPQKKCCFDRENIARMSAIAVRSHIKEDTF
ncbi:hypothetical protein SDC9_187399 [bioreactor metagenome]|uniref:Uncharacterized protein n=1 Tax=bioreactor metagenome TaxID=1076179 RepID=A0A645HLF1_9ZZZZ